MSQAPTTTALAVLSGVNRTYGGGENAVHALQDVDLELGRGELIVVLGPSGSGKTTLLNILGGIERPTAGRVVVAGRDLTAASSHELTEIRRDVIGFVFQFFNLIATLTARENVSVLAELTGHARDERVDAVLADVGLTDRADHFPAQLSGGQQQRVAIARALANDPPILIADEPTGRLDSNTAETIFQIFLDLVRQGKTILMVTHDRNLSRRVSRTLQIVDGEIELENGSNGARGNGTHRELSGNDG
jgi:putative ABC transport system ATP-binding protein